MGLLSIFRRRADPPSNVGPASEPADAVQKARTRARQRLIGAVVLVGVGIIGFPLVFETQPRPIPVDIPIEMPRKEGAPPLVMPAGRTSTGVATTPAAPATSGRPTPAEAITEPRADAGRGVAASAAAAMPVAPVAPLPAPRPQVAAAVEQLASTKPMAEPNAGAPSADGARAKALLEGKPEVGAAPARFVVQVGAFADVDAARETRQKVEKLGLKTYTQVANTAEGNRIRVRVGPFATRDEADKALAKARASGMAAVVLTL